MRLLCWIHVSSYSRFCKVLVQELSVQLDKGFLLSAYDLMSSRWTPKQQVIHPSHKSHNAQTYPTMHHFVTEMCTHVHISVTQWCIVGYSTVALWDFWIRSVKFISFYIITWWNSIFFCCLIMNYHGLFTLSTSVVVIIGQYWKNSVFYINFGYAKCIYVTLWTHKKHTIAHPHRWAVECHL